jgi:hypothetical protein
METGRSYKPTPKNSFGPGTYIVGKDIQPGKYRSESGADYWARLSGFGGEVRDIIANAAFVTGPTIVEIRSTDKGFQSQGGYWEKID